MGGRPSWVAQRVMDHAERHGMGIVFTLEGNPAIEALGLVVRAQRSVDVLTTRPVFVARE
ncbi:hypothetical protein [Embleya hyalina]|uniref:Uncharacterized protein n=1 Tax=Embleya hyalina TaxID=516124 RepID=A0A401YTD0_9ACTN|nr:hypothetical protein [Embleya hyalina]GCD97829.1 hypothetical protein EHYA_05526 [Embleya hyalina]